MDIVDIAAVALRVGLAEVLAASDELPYREVGNAQTLHALAGDELNAPALAGLTCKKGLCLGEEVRGLCVEDDLVDRLEGDGVVVDIHELGKRVTRRRRLALRLRKGPFELLPMALCRGEAVVAVAHCKNHGVVRKAVLAAQDLGLRELFGGPCEPVVILDEPAGYAASALHELKVIDLLPFCHGGKDDIVRIVHEYHDMRHLERRIAADPYARGQPVLHGVLGRSNGAVRPLGPVVGLKVEHSHYAAADRAVSESAFKADIAVGTGPENALIEIAAHCGVYPDALALRILCAELGLRQHKIKR